MEKPRFTARTHQQIAEDLNLSISAYYRKRKARGLSTSRGIQSPDEIVRIYIALGYRCLLPEELLLPTTNLPHSLEMERRSP